MVRKRAPRRTEPKRPGRPRLPRPLATTIDLLQAELSSVEVASAFADAVRTTGRFLEALRDDDGEPPSLAQMRPIARRWLVVLEAGLRVAESTLDGAGGPRPPREKLTRIPVSSSPPTPARRRTRHRAARRPRG